MRNCPHCGARLRAGRAALHLSATCQTAWYQRVRAQHGRRPWRPKDWDLTPEMIERIMARRAAQQRYERAMAQREQA